MKLTPLGPNGRQWLKSLHLILSVIWLGAAISMNMLRFTWMPSAGSDLYAVDHGIALIDRWVVIPAAFASLLTGLLESALTSWGFFKYRWVTVKWIGTIAVMVYAPLFVSPWDRELEIISRAQGLLALQNPLYIQDRWLYSLSGVTLIAILAFMAVISTFKPWTRQDKLNARPARAAVKPEVA